MSEEQALDVALAAAAAAGASDAQVTAVRAREVRLRRRRGRMEESTEATTRSASLDVWVDGRFGSATTTDLRPGTLADFVRRLVELTRELEPDPDRRIADPSLFPAGEAPPLDLVDPALAILDREGREAMLVELAEPLEGVPDTLSSTASVSTAHTLRLHGTSNGLRTSWEETQVGVFVTATVPDRGDRRSEDRAWATCRHLGDLPELGSLGREALRRARARVGSSVGATRRATVVVEPRAAGHLLRWLLTGTDGHALHQSRSFWLGREGRAVVSDRLELTDDPWLRRGLASCPHDRDGVATRPRPVLRGGALTHVWLTPTYARKLGRPPTTAGPTNLVVTPGERDLDTIVGSVRDGVLVTDWVGGNLSESTGDFSAGLRGFELRGGERAGPVGEMNLSGNLLSLFAALSEVADAPFRWSAVASPALRFEGQQLSGT